MNLLLLTANEAAASPVRLRDDRARQLREVLRVSQGDRIRVGVIDGPLGSAEVLEVDPTAVTLACQFAATVPSRTDDTLLLAVPRPVVLRRCLAQAAALGYGRLVLFRTWHVDKSHLAARILQPERLRTELLDGLSQARRTQLPEVRFFPLFKPFVEDSLEGLLPDGPRFVAHPVAENDVAHARIESEPFTLAIGPERGFTAYEVDALANVGFQPVRSDTHPLRVETAVAVLTGQLALLRRLA